MTAVDKRLFGTVDGADVYEYIITSDKLTVAVCNLGATVTKIIVPTAKGNIDVALCYENPEQLLTLSDYNGATVGRCANRISGGRFTLHGNEYTLFCNDNANHLHGGKRGYDKRLFEAREVSCGVEMRLFDKDGEEGYCGNVDFSVTFTVDGGALLIEYRAKSDKDTVFNVTNHSYFNLNGQDDGCISDNLLQINADGYLPVDEGLIPLGQVQSVEGTPMDFRRAKPIGQDLNADFTQLKIAGGYDHCYCLSGSFAAKAYSPKTGITMDVFTDRKGLQFYSGNFLKGNKGKSVYPKHSGFCLETQNYPNAINTAEYCRQSLLPKDQNFYSKTTYAFYAADLQ
ncbi:MAG: galactose mutarotase [Corallococcus sp.]|nr:galactose mutarotase [Corallococcus sp.]